MIYLFDKNENLIKLVKKDAIKSALQKFTLTTEKYVSDRLTVEMKDLTAQELEQVEYMAIQSIEDAHKFHFFYIAQKFSEKLTTLIGVQSGIEELRKSVVLDKRPKNSFARPVIEDLLRGTNWQARFVSETSQRSTNFYYISTFEALKKVCQVWNLEMQFFVEVNGNKIGARYIDFKQKIGEATGKRVVYGHNALQILQEVERTNLFTALIGRGKGEEVSGPTNEGGYAGYGRRVTFEDIVWEKTKGAPVDKPKGQKYVELPEMTKKYGIKNADGTMRAKIGFVVFEQEEDANVLIRRTYEQLVNASRPQLTLKTSTVYLKDVNIGDTIRVVRHDKKLDYDTRIFEITFNRLNNESSDIKLGDRISESNEAKIQNIASQKADELISSSFNSLIKNLPDFLPSADGLNKNWYGANDPTKTHAGKVVINDIWFKPNPEHEGQTIMLRWTGEVWEEVIRSNNSQEIIDEINKRFDNLNISGVDEAKAKAEEALKKAGASTDLAYKAKSLSDQILGDMNTFKSDYRADLNGINLRITQTTANNVQMFSAFTNDVNGRMAQMASKVEGKANQTDFQRVKETAQLYERILGGAENDVSRNISRLVMSDQVFQTEVGNYVINDNNLIVNSQTLDKSTTSKLKEGVSIVNNNGVFTIDINGLTSPYWGGFTLPIYVPKILKGEVYTLGFKYRIMRQLDHDFRVTIKNHGKNKTILQKTVENANSPVLSDWKEFQGTFTMTEDFDFGTDAHYPLFFYLVKNGHVEVKEPMLVRGYKTGSFKPSQFDEAYRGIEATRTQVTQLSNSWAVKALNNAGDILGQLNLNKDGSVHINEALVAVGEKTYIQDGVIKKSMIGNAQIGTAHIDEIDASLARLINVSAKNIVADGLTANIIRGGKLSSLNGVTDFDLQTGWIEMNQEAVGIRNRFPGKPMQFLIFGQGAINGVPGAYTQLMSNRNGRTGIEHTSAGIQIWNGRSGNNVQTSITFYGKSMVFSPSSIAGGVTLNTESKTLQGMNDILIRDKSLAELFNLIDKNFKGLEDHLKRNNLGAPGYYRTNM